MSTSVKPMIAQEGKTRGAQRARWSHTKRALAAYLGVSAFCLLFSNVYALFSHEVSSPFMTYLALIPLLGGAAVAGVRLALGAREAPRMARYSYHCGIATLTVASALRGVFDIAGTSSPWLIVYAVLAAALLALALIALIRKPDCRTQ